MEFLHAPLILAMGAAVGRRRLFVIAILAEIGTWVCVHIGGWQFDSRLHGTSAFEYVQQLISDGYPRLTVILQTLLAFASGYVLQAQAADSPPLRPSWSALAKPLSGICGLAAVYGLLQIMRGSASVDSGILDLHRLTPSPPVAVADAAVWTWLTFPPVSLALGYAGSWRRMRRLAIWVVGLHGAIAIILAALISCVVGGEYVVHWPTWMFQSSVPFLVVAAVEEVASILVIVMSQDMLSVAGLALVAGPLIWAKEQGPVPLLPSLRPKLAWSGQSGSAEGT
jgi:hypothetical protein